MINVGIIEDEREAAERLESLLNTYCREHDCEINVSIFGSAEEFGATQAKVFDLVFMDIELPGADGMTAAAHLRRHNADVIIVFLTHVSRLAAKGYSVGALDYIVKPIESCALGVVMDRARMLIERHMGIKIAVNTSDGLVCLDSAAIKYVEVYGHCLIFHIDSGDVKEWGNLKKPESQLTAHGFARCNNCYLVNLRYVTGIIGNTVTVAGEMLKISRGRANAFMLAVNEYLGK